MTMADEKLERAVRKSGAGNSDLITLSVLINIAMSCGLIEIKDRFDQIFTFIYIDTRQT